MNTSQDLRRTLTATAQVPLTAARLAWRVLPALVALVALGLALRSAALWAASSLSDVWPLGAALVLPLAPLALMSFLILALWALRPKPLEDSADKSSGAGAGTSTDAAAAAPGRGGLPRAGLVARSHLIGIGALLIPFLSVYASNGFLKEDVRRFVHDAALDEAVNSFADTDFSRVVMGAGWQVAALVVITLVVRKIMGYAGVVTRGGVWAGAAAYVEVIWMVTASVVIAANTASIREWTTSRAVIAPVLDAADSVVSRVTGHTATFTGVVNSLGGLLGRFDDVVVVPVAWLTLGAVVYGTTLTAAAIATSPTTDASRAAKEDTEPKATSPSAVSAAVSKHVAARTTTQAQVLAESVTKPIVGPIKSTWAALKKIAVAGVAPMVTLCAVFVLARGVESLVAWAGHTLIGPTDVLTLAGLEPYVMYFARLAYFVVALPLVAAGLDAIYGARNTSVGSGSVSEA